MQYKFLRHLNDVELKQLEDIILGKVAGSEILQQIEIAKSQFVDCLDYNFACDYIPNYDKQLENRCIEILTQVKVNDLPFFIESCVYNGNNRQEYYRSVERISHELKDESIMEDYKIFKRLIFYMGCSSCEEIFLNSVDK